jgi:hypothetical protein
MKILDCVLLPRGSKFVHLNNLLYICTYKIMHRESTFSVTHRQPCESLLPACRRPKAAPLLKLIQIDTILHKTSSGYMLTQLHKTV